MIRVDRRSYGSIWAFVAILLAAGWAAYGLIGGGNAIFLTLMVVATIILGGGVAVLVRPRDSSNTTET
ncbi:MAG TPA: hypothetical protein VH349_16605 [Ktedonobacterales bacterium]|jgi:hypothetical protein